MDRSPVSDDAALTTPCPLWRGLALGRLLGGPSIMVRNYTQKIPTIGHKQSPFTEESAVRLMNWPLLLRRVRKTEDTFF